MLVEVLKTAGVLSNNLEPEDTNIILHGDVGDNSISILDLGFGCGDQTLFLSRMARGHCCFSTESQRDENKHFANTFRLSEPALNTCHLSYVGITSNAAQACLATKRLRCEHENLSCNEIGRVKMHLFVGDGAKPDTWTEKPLRAALEEAFFGSKQNFQGSEDHEGSEGGIKLQEGAIVASVPRRWILALDTLYHFRPSRAALFHYARTELGASIMAFDIVRYSSSSDFSGGSAGDITFLNKIFLRMAAWLSGCSPQLDCSFPTQDEYINLIVRAGYSREKIEIRDVTDHVFAPLADFMAFQDQKLRVYGLGLGGGLRMARWLFRWWAGGNVVRGVIMVARV